MGKAFVAKLAKEGARDPEALAAWIGRKKHGKAFAKLSAAGRKKADGADGKKTETGSALGKQESTVRRVSVVDRLAPPGAKKGTPAQVKQIAEISSAIDHALANGWEAVPGSRPGEVKIRRTTTHDTPEGIPDRWWGSPTYEAHEFISVVSDGIKIVGAFREESNAPWVGGRGAQKISAKKAREFLNT